MHSQRLMQIYVKRESGYKLSVVLFTAYIYKPYGYIVKPRNIIAHENGFEFHAVYTQR